MIRWVVYLLRIFKMFHGLMNNPVLSHSALEYMDQDEHWAVWSSPVVVLDDIHVTVSTAFSYLILLSSSFSSVHFCSLSSDGVVQVVHVDSCCICYMWFFDSFFLSLFIWLYVLCIPLLNSVIYVFLLIRLCILIDRLCGLVVRVSGNRYRGPGFDSRRYQIFWVVVGLERGPLSLVRSIEELLE